MKPNDYKQKSLNMELKISLATELFSALSETKQAEIIKILKGFPASEQ